MEAIKAKVEFVEINGDVPAQKPEGDMVSELNDLELALVGGGAIDFNF
jgi:hypothetical protein